MRETALESGAMVQQMLTISRVLAVAKNLHNDGLPQDKAIRLASMGWDPAQRLN